MTPLFDIIVSEMINRGHNEIYTENTIIAFDRQESFINKIMLYDYEVSDICNELIFKNIMLENFTADELFKKHFINKFLNAIPCTQTIELFSSKVNYVFLNNIDFLNEYYDNITEYMRGKGNGENISTDVTVSDNRLANATLPQSEVNINVDNTILTYADENSINRNKTSSEKTGTEENYNYDIEKLINSRNILEEIFNQFDKYCFLQVF